MDDNQKYEEPTPAPSKPEDKFQAAQMATPLHGSIHDAHFGERQITIKRVFLNLFKHYNTTVKAPIDSVNINFFSEYISSSFLLHDAVARHPALWKVEAAFSNQRKVSEVQPALVQVPTGKVNE